MEDNLDFNGKIIDTHVHVWDLEKLNLPWLNHHETLKKTYTSAEYSAKLKRRGVEKAVYIEVDSHESDKEKESDLAFKHCRDSNCELEGAIIACSLENEDAKTLIEKHAKNPHFKGVRRPLHVESAPKGLCLEKRFIENLRCLGRLGFVFDACIRAEELKDLVEAARQCPETFIILDHIGNVAEEILLLSKKDMPSHPWIKDLKKFSELSNTICKISTLNISPSKEKIEGAKALIEICLDFFGEDRIVFGSNWPVSEAFWGVDEWFNLVKGVLIKTRKGVMQKIFYENAKRIYRL